MPSMFMVPWFIWAWAGASVRNPANAIPEARAVSLFIEVLSSGEDISMRLPAGGRSSGKRYALTFQ